MVNKITITRGRGKSHSNDLIDKIDFYMGDLISILGPTGSGKTTLINDIELFAKGNTPTKRHILIDDEYPSTLYKRSPADNPIALITQHTNFLSDLPVIEFLKIHAGVRNKDKSKINLMIEEVLEFANQLTGEPILINSKMTELSGGQTRSLLIADATVICKTPIVLLDEVENAGINRIKAIELLRAYQKIFIFVTHDPRIAFLSDYRIIMEDGHIKDVIVTTKEEKECCVYVDKVDNLLCSLRDKLRVGKKICKKDLEWVI